MKIGAGKVIGAAMFAAGVAAIWLWPKQKAEVSEDTVVRPVRSMVVTGKATLPELRCPGKVRAGESRDLTTTVDVHDPDHQPYQGKVLSEIGIGYDCQRHRNFQWFRNQ